MLRQDDMFVVTKLSIDGLLVAKYEFVVYVVMFINISNMREISN